MRIKLQEDDSFRILADYEEKNYINVAKLGNESIAVDLHAQQQYIEIRRKGKRIRVFSFAGKSDRDGFCFGWWEDADIILSLNESCG